MSNQEAGTTGSQVVDKAPTVTVFEPWSEGFIADPYATYARLRASYPVYWSEQLQVWVVSRYEECSRVLTDHEFFSSDYREHGGDSSPAATCIQSLEPPEHTPLRRLLVSSFKQVFNQSLSERVRQMTRTALDTAAASRTPVNAVDQLCVSLATMVTLELLGVAVDRERLAEVSRAVVRSMMAKVEHDAVQPGMDARREMAEILEKQLRDGKLEPTGMLCAIREDPGYHTVEPRHLINSLRVVLLAGINSTQRFLANSLLALLTQPDGLRQFERADNVTRALHELARFDGPFQAQEKVVRAEVTLLGQTLRRGEYVVALTGAANRDESVFADPDMLLLSRVKNPHLGFGVGRHACLGAPLALRLGRELLTEVSKRFPSTHVAGTPVRDSNPTLRGLVSLPIKLA